MIYESNSASCNPFCRRPLPLHRIVFNKRLFLITHYSSNSAPLHYNIHTRARRRDILKVFLLVVNKLLLLLGETVFELPPLFWTAQGIVAWNRGLPVKSFTLTKHNGRCANSSTNSLVTPSGGPKEAQILTLLLDRTWDQWRNSVSWRRPTPIIARPRLV